MKRLLSIVLTLVMLTSCFFIPQTVSADTVAQPSDSISADAPSQTTSSAVKDTSINAKAYNATATSVSIKWEKEKGVSKYSIYRSTKKNKGYKKITTTSKAH